MVMGAGFGVLYLLGIAAIWVLVAMVLVRAYRVLSLKHKMSRRAVGSPETCEWGTGARSRR